MINLKTISTILFLFIFFIIENLLPHYKNRILKNRIIYSFQNIILALFNSILVYLIYNIFLKILFFAGTSIGKQITSSGILNLLKIPYLINIVISFLLLDLWMYFWHFINHNTKFLWKFHRAHHSDIEMDSSTAIRFHTGEIIISLILKLPITILIGITPEIVLFHEIIISISTIFHHSNIALPESIDGILRVIIVTPNMHRVHHSQVMEETNSNYTSIFSFWDRLFKTFILNKNTLNIKLGLKEFVDKKWQNLWGIFITPFVKI